MAAASVAFRQSLAIDRMWPARTTTLSGATFLSWMASRAFRKSLQGTATQASCEAMAQLWTVGTMALYGATSILDGQLRLSQVAAGDGHTVFLQSDGSAVAGGHGGA